MLAVISVICLLVALIGPANSGKQTIAERQACLAKLGQIAVGLQAYLSDSANRWPYVAKLQSVRLDSAPWPTLPVVLAQYLQGKSDVFHCPADSRRLDHDSPLLKRFHVNTTYFATEGTSYEWWFGEVYGGKKVGEEMLSRAGGFGMGRADQPLLTDFGPFHTGDKQGAVNTLNADLKPRTTRVGPGH